MLNIDFNFIDISDPNKDKYNFDFGDFVNRHYILKGTSNNFNSIWCDDNTSLTAGKLYISTNDSITIVNLNTNNIEDYYTTSVAGRSEDVLKSNDIIDITIAR